jgi:hypothetical protein
MVSMCRLLTIHSDCTAVFSTRHETLPFTVESACLVGDLAYVWRVSSGISLQPNLTSLTDRCAGIPLLASSYREIILKGGTLALVCNNVDRLESTRSARYQPLSF